MGKIKRHKPRTEDKMDFELNIRAKACIFTILGYLLFLTWIILCSKLNLYIQCFCLLMTIIITYVHLILIKDHVCLRMRLRRAKMKYNIKLERERKNVN